MSDPQAFDVQPTDPGDRDGRVEALLVDGLDRYFTGQYEDAIHLWTRVLFLDRSHARARAYIDRARTALAERHRHADEMLHASGELLSRGRTGEARDLLNQAVATSGDTELTAALRVKLERVERAHGSRAEPRSAAVADVVPVRSWRAWWRSFGPVWMAVILGVTVLVFVGGLTLREAPTDLASTSLTQPVERPAARVVPSSAEAALVRARTLYSRGRLAEALRALDRVGAGSTRRAEADQLRAEIQQRLLAARRGASPARVDSARGRP
jgi:tetratricopeptide (TPR) repeat protein